LLDAHDVDKSKALATAIIPINFSHEIFII
jgi:hypothetical protein